MVLLAHLKLIIQRRNNMNWLNFIIVIVATLCLTKILYTAQKYAKTKGTPQVLWIHVAFWVFWTFTFLLYIGLFGLMVWVGISMFTEGNIKGAVKMLLIALLLAPCIYQLFIHPSIRRNTHSDM